MRRTTWPGLVSDVEHKELARGPSLVTDPAGQLLCVGDAFAELVGLRGEDWLDKPPPHPWWPPEDHDLARELGRLQAEGLSERLGVREFNVRLLHASGRRIPVRLGHRVLKDERGRAALHVLTVLCEPDQTPASPELVLDQIRARVDELREILQRLEPELRAEDETPAVAAGLSGREREVCAQLVRGHAPRAIARELCISEHTVRNHAKAVYRKLGVHSRVELVRAWDRLTS